MTSNQWERPTSSRPSGPIVLEGEVVGEQVTITSAPPQEPFFGTAAGRLGRQLILAAVAVLVLLIAVPMVLVALAFALVGALIGRKLITGRFGFDGLVRGFGRPRP